MEREIIVSLKTIAIAALLSIASAASASGGRQVYESVCMACHAPENVMVAAPKAGDAAEWRRRLARSAKGLDTLADHAVDGFGAMPAKGGRDELTRAEILAAIGFMMAQPGKAKD